LMEQAEWPQTWKTPETLRKFSKHRKRLKKTQGIVSECCATSGKNCSKQNGITRCSFWGAKML